MWFATLVIIGSMNTVRPDIVDVAMHQKLEMKRLSKRKQLVERVKDGSVRIYFNMRKMSHEKLYILSADDGRCRIITGSANLSKRAFTGGQYEEITCFDGDVVMFDNRLARFESLKGMSSTTPLEPAAMVDFASVAGDSEGELEVVPVMRAKGVVYLCDMPEDDDEVETFYTFNPKDMTEEEREQYAAMREHRAGGHFRNGDQVGKLVHSEPTVKLNSLGLNEGHGGIAASHREQADLEEAPEELHVNHWRSPPFFRWSMASTTPSSPAARMM